MAAVECIEYVIPGVDGASVILSSLWELVPGLVAALIAALLAVAIWKTFRSVSRQWIAFAAGSMAWGALSALYTLWNFAFNYRWATGNTMWDVAPGIIGADLLTSLLQAAVVALLVALLERRDIKRWKRATAETFD